MNIFNKVTLQSMKKSRTRTIVTIIGVILASAMITGVATFGVSLLNYMANGAVQKYGDWHVGYLNASSSFVQGSMKDGEVESAAIFENVGYASLAGAKNPKKPYLFVAGYSEDTLSTLPVTLISGRMPTSRDEVVVSGRVTSDGGLKIAVEDKLSLAIGNRMKGEEKLVQDTPYSAGDEMFVPLEERTFTVVGISQTPSFEGGSAPGYTLITKADGANDADSYGLFLKLKNPRKVHSFAESTPESGGIVLNDHVLRFMGLSADNVFNVFLYAVGGIVVAIIMIGSIFLIYNAFTISLNERTRQFGILSSVGATERQLRNTVLFEGLCIGAIGIPIGIFVGIGSMGLVISSVAANIGSIAYSGVPLTLTLSVPAIVVAAVVSLVTILISAYIPARKAASTPVMESIRQTNEVKEKSKALKTSVFSQRLFGLEGTLALKNFKRNRKRYRSIVLSLVLSVVLFISASSFVANMKQASERAMVVTDYDIGLATRDMSDSDMLTLYNKLKSASDIYESSYQALMKYSVNVAAAELTDAYWQSLSSTSQNEAVKLSVAVQFLEDHAYLKLLDGQGLSVDEYTGEHAKLLAVAQAQGAQVSPAGHINNMFANSSMDINLTPLVKDEPLEGLDQRISVTFVEIVPPDSLPILEKSQPEPYFFRIMAPYSLKEKFEAPEIPVVVKGLTFLSKNPSQSVAQMEGLIRDAGIKMTDHTLYNLNKALDENRNIIFIVNIFAYTFIIMISLIAVANVFNTISTNIKLRRRELAMLRSIGMSERDFQKMMNFECVFYGMRTLVLGLPISAISSWLIYKGMVVGGADSIDYVFPWGSMGVSVLSVLFIVFVTMLYAVSKIKKENIIDALRDDMT